MADIGMPMSPFEDQKAAKAKLKADKLEYRKKLKEQRKADKEKLHEFAERTAELSGDDAGGIATIVITFFIVLIWLAIMALLIKFNVGNFGSDIMAPLIKDIPVINAILPKEARNDVDAKIDEPIDFSTEGSEAGGIQTIEEANAYIKRLENLENIANTTKGVDKSYAIQAGREIRVAVKPNQVRDDEVPMLAREIAKKIEAELEYPGQIKVNVIRETRATDYAK